MTCAFSHFYSDPHFGHSNIIQYCNRPFVDVVEMERELVSRYNAVVSADDHVLWVGDCFWGRTDGGSILGMLNGRKSLVRGNHDQSVAKMLKMGFFDVSSRLSFHLGNYDVVASHYPPKLSRLGMETVDRFADRRPTPEDGFYYMHGHTHEPGTGEDYRIHVGVDAWNYAPVSSADIELLIMGRERSRI